MAAFSRTLSAGAPCFSSSNSIHFNSNKATHPKSALKCRINKDSASRAGSTSPERGSRSSVESRCLHLSRFPPRCSCHRRTVQLPSASPPSVAASARMPTSPRRSLPAQRRRCRAPESIQSAPANSMSHITWISLRSSQRRHCRAPGSACCAFDDLYP